MVRDKSKAPKGRKGNNDGSSSDDSGSEEQMDMHAYRSLLSKIFPSKHMSDKMKELDKVDKASSPTKGKKSTKDKKKKESGEKGKKNEKITLGVKPKSRGKKKVVESSSDSEAGVDESSDDVSESDGSDNVSDGEINQILKGKKNHKFNIIFTMGGPLSINQSILGEDDEEWDTDESYDSEDYTDDEDDSEWDEDETSSDESYAPPRRSKRLNGKKVKEESESESDSSDSDSDDPVNKMTEKEIIAQYKKTVVELLKKNKKSKLLKTMMKDAEEKEKTVNKDSKKRDRKQKLKNAESFRSLIKEKNPMNDMRFFRDELTVEQQKKIIEEVKKVKALINVEKPYRLKLLDADIPREYKACALKKVNTLRYMEPGASEYYKLKNWVDTFMQIPFGSYGSLPITIDDGVDKCHDFMANAQNKLNDAVYGLNDAKMQIMQMIGQWIANPDAIGTAIAIKGPMGTGKTTLVKDGISKILGRDFAFIALGGATDSSFLEGHSYTYEGSTWGKIVEILLRCKTMNPVIYFDELDKVSDTPKGEEIAGILTHLTDTSQNNKFHDKYFSEVDFDLSKCLFIFSYNDESRINPILKDRMYGITTKGYKKDEKIKIANDYLLPRIREQCNFKKGDIVIPDESIEYLADMHTHKEEGVRNLKRCLEVIHTKLNLFRLMKDGTNLFEQQMSMKVSFPYTVTRELIDKLIKREDTNGPPEGMYI